MPQNLRDKLDVNSFEYGLQSAHGSFSDLYTSVKISTNPANCLQAILVTDRQVLQLRTLGARPFTPQTGGSDWLEAGSQNTLDTSL